jgi:hypothetical protein
MPMHDFFDMVPERLVVFGFRQIMATHDTGDGSCLEQAWREYIRTVGEGPARRLMGELQFWVRGIRNMARRDLNYFPCACRRICHDECMAVAMIAAAQSQDQSLTLKAAEQLLGTQEQNAMRELWAASMHFAAALKQDNLELFPITAEVIDSIVAVEQRNQFHPNKQTLN